jgi:Zn-dependent M28 family amino/carboxypeptidase
MELPAAALGSEDAAHLFRALDAGKVTVELELQSTVTGPAQVPSVIAELPGTDPAAGWILIGAHLDSWDFATGSQDNGAGVIQVIATARALAAAGPLKRTVRFALFGGEEQGMIGSYAYAAAHQAELASCVAMLNTDNGAGHVVGWKVQGRKDVEAALAPIAQGLLGGLGGGQLDLELEADTDHFAFVAAGVPALNLSVDMAGYDRIHHTAADTVEKVDAHALASGVAVLAVTAYALASSTAAFAPHLDRAAVVELLKPEGLDEMMRAFGLWK